MSRAALDRYQLEMDRAVGDEYAITRLDRLWDEAADKLNADYEGDLNALTTLEYSEAIAALIDWSAR